jgi:DNA-directed RNA polymerase specialized sigma24 family protein
MPPDCVDSETLSTLVAQLRAKYREELILRAIEDPSYMDLAAVAGTPVGTVTSRLSRARPALRNAWIHDDRRP